ncbi:MAG: oligosaccharide flippase family protein, partial [PVC group bacterium]
VTVWALCRGIGGALAASAFSFLAADFYLFAAARKLAGRPAFRVRLPYLRDLFRYGFPSHLGNLFSFLHHRADLLLVNWFLGPAAVGFYAISALLAEKFWMMTNAASLVLFPRVAAEEDSKRRNEFTPRVSRAILLVTVPVALVIGLTAPPLVDLLFSPRYFPAVRPLRILLPGAAALGVSRVLANDIAGRGRPLLNTVVTAGALALNLALNWIWIPRFGIEGAAGASTVSYSATLLARLCVYCRLSGNSWKNVLLPRRDDWLLAWKMLQNRGFRRIKFRGRPGRCRRS